MPGGLGVDDVNGVCASSGVPILVLLAASGLLLKATCLVACLLVDHGRSRLAFCITKERALRRPWRELLAVLEESTKRKSRVAVAACWFDFCFPFPAGSLRFSISLLQFQAREIAVLFPAYSKKVDDSARKAYDRLGRDGKIYASLSSFITCCHIHAAWSC